MPTKERALKDRLLAPAPAPPSEELDAWRWQRSKLVLGDLDATHERAPCHWCPHAARCSVERLACDQYRVFIRVPRRERWQFASRQPSAAIHAQIAAWLDRIIRTEQQARVISSDA